MAGLKPEYAFIEFYISLVSYSIIHQIFVIASDFVDALNIPPLNIGIYVDKLAAIRALLMAMADILEWAVTQEWLGDPGAFKKLTEPSPRRIGSVLSFFAMWACRVYYLWAVYYSENKSLVAFITLSVEGFWFGVFQMGFFAIGPEYNAFTSLAIHTMGNIIFFFQLIMESMSETRPDINSLYRVRIHGWICLISTSFALLPWIYFCHAYVYHDSPQYKGLVETLKGTNIDQEDASKADKIAKALATKMAIAQVTGQKVTNLVEKEFGLPSASITPNTAGNTVTVNANGGGSETHTETVTVKKTEASSGGKGTITIEVSQAKSEAQARRIARRLAKTLTQVTSVTKTGGGSENVTVTMTPIEWYHSLSPVLLFPIGSFPEDFLCPGILPFAFLDAERANVVNYTMPLFFMIGAIIILFLNDVFSAEKSILGTKLMKDYDSQFKEWSEGQAMGWNAMWLLNAPKFSALFISLWAIHGIYPGLRKIVQSRWRVMLLTFNVIVPRATLEVMGYVGVANYAIAAGEAGDYSGFKILAWHDVLAMSCRFIFGKLAVGYNWTRVSLGYDFQRDPGHYPWFPVL